MSGVRLVSGGEERTVEWLAEASATHLPSLRRLLTAARALDLVRNGEVDGTYVLGSLGRRAAMDLQDAA